MLAAAGVNWTSVLADVISGLILLILAATPRYIDRRIANPLREHQEKDQVFQRKILKRMKRYEQYARTERDRVRSQVGQ